jgi:hypothetical protein
MIVLSQPWVRIVFFDLVCLSRLCPFLAALAEGTRVTRHISMRIDALDGERGIGDRGSGFLYHFSFVAIGEEGSMVRQPPRRCF